MKNPLIHLKNFEKKYGDRPIIQISEASFDPGLYWIKGNNGSGKTTFFKALAGLLPFSGSISFSDGISLTQHPMAYRQRVNYAEAEPLYPGFLTGRDLVRFVGTAKQADIIQQNELIANFAMNDYWQSPCDTYSSGMQKKLSLALAFLGTPQLLILDEPLITLDNKAKASLVREIAGVLDTQAVVMVSSHQLLAEMDLHLRGQFEIRDRQLLPL